LGLIQSWILKACALTCIVGLITLSHAQSTSTTSHPKSSSASHKASSSHKKGKKSKKKTASSHGQRNIDPERARAIQEALIREHYMEGTPSGKWDDASQKAMQKYQADHGWQSKNIPDSRALIQLGLGPDHEHLLNPESAMTTAPSTHAVPGSPAAASAEDKPHE